MFNKACIAMIIATLFLLSSAAAAITGSDIALEPSLAEAVGMESIFEESAVTSDGEADFDSSVMQGFFTENDGQWSDDIRFIARTSFGVMAFTDDSVLYDLPTDDNGTKEMVKLTFVDSNIGTIVPSSPLDHKSNFFIGNDESKWCSDVTNYAELIYVNVWGGIDIHYFFTEAGMKYEFILAPYSDVSDISISVDGADISTIGDTLTIRTEFNTIIDDFLCAFHSDNGGEVTASFVVDDYEYSFNVDGWDDSRELIIDPLVYSTYVGGSSEEYAYSIAIDSSGNAFVTGNTYSTDFPTTAGAYQTSYAGEYYDAFILKLNPTGSDLVYSTYVGGNGNNQIRSIAIDSIGDAFVAGYTGSTDFPTTAGAFQTSYAGGSDAFILRLNTDGSDIVYSTYVGGTKYEDTRSIAIDSSGYAFVTGETTSTDFPTTAGAFQTSNAGGCAAFILKLNPTGSALVNSTYVGGSGYDSPYSIAIDSSGNAFIVGETWSTDFPTTAGAFQASYAGLGDVFILKLNSDGSHLIYSTYVGGSSNDFGYSIAIDSTGNAFVTGYTTSTDFNTTAGAYQTSKSGNHDAFILKLNPTGGDLVYSTYIGGSDLDHAYSIAIDSYGNALVTGHTGSTDFPTTAGAYQTSYAGEYYDAFILKLNPTGSDLVYSTYIGGSGSDHGKSIAIDSSGNAFVAGYTGSTYFPTTAGAFQTSYAGGSDTFILKLIINGSWVPTLINSPDDGKETVPYVYVPRFNETATVTAYLTNSPFLLWNGSAYTGTPSTTQSGTYWIVISAKSTSGMLIAYQNYTLIINDTWTPTFTNSPSDGKETVAYVYGPTFNETATIAAYSTNAPFLSWNGSAYVGTPDMTEAGTYWINISATSTAGLLTSYQNYTLVINDTWAPTFTNCPANGKESVAYAYGPTFNETATIAAYSTNAPFLTWSETAYTGTPSTTQSGTYWINITGTSTAGLLTTCQNSTFTVNELTTPSAPQNPQASSGDGQVTLTWSAPLDDGGAEITYYKIYRGTSGPESHLATVGNVLTFVDDDVVNGETYYYKVVAVNSEGDGTESTTIIATSEAGGSEGMDVMVWIIAIVIVVSAAIAAVYLVQRRKS